MYGIYHVYTLYIHRVYTMYIPCVYMLILLEQLNLLFSGFHGTHRPNAPPSHGTADNVPDEHDEADFDTPDTQCWKDSCPIYLPYIPT